MSDDDWLVPARSIDVEITDLAAFADLVAGDRDGFLWAKATGPDVLLAEDPPFEAGIAEIGQFQQAYTMHKLSMLELLRAAEAGLTALAEGARQIAREYTGSDAMAAADIESVIRTFTPPDRAGAQQAGQGYDGHLDDDVAQEWQEHVDAVREDPEAGLTPGEGDDSGRDTEVLADGLPGEYVMEADDDDVASLLPRDTDESGDRDE